MAAAGVTPEDINVVLCTHLHVDHVGWNTRLENGRWVPTFPNARYLIAQREWDYWRGVGPAAFAFTGDYITDSVLPIFKTGQADLIGDQHMLASDIALEAAPGHTPGQGRLVFPTHFPAPTGGIIVRNGSDYRFVFDGERCIVPSNS